MLLTVCFKKRLRQKINIQAAKAEVDLVRISGKLMMIIKPQTRFLTHQVLPAGVSDFVGLKEAERP